MKRFAFRPYLLLLWAATAIVASSVATDPFAMWFLAILGTPLLLLLSFLWPARWTIRHPMFRNMVAIPVALAVLISVLWTSWPLRLSYLAARPALRTLADRVEKGEKIQTPCRAGIFTIRKAERDWHGVVMLWTNTHDGNEFVLTSAENVKSGFNVWFTVRLDEDVQFVWED
jgi:hypothetical protein